MGALEPRKNLVRLLDAYTALAAEPAGHGVGLVIVGPTGWKYQPILDAVSRVSRRNPIFLLEPVSTEVLVALYHLATVLAFPSLYEGFGLPSVEAMMCGTPVVTSGRGALAEIAGDAAEFVDPLRVESISEGLLRVLDDAEHAADLRRRGLVRARDFCWRRAARETRALYAEISGGTVGAPGLGLASVPRLRTGLAPGGETRTDERTRELENAIVQSVSYADVFDYPLTAHEVHRYLIGVRASASEVGRALAGSRLAPGRLAHRDGFFTLPGREQIVELRRQRKVPAKRLWRGAVHYGRRIAGLPFVRMVAVTGSLAASNVTRDADVDYLIVTAPRRLWICRALVIGVVRRAARRGVVLCPNFLLTESALELRQRDLYTAWELAQMVPIAGFETYHRLRRRNSWAGTFLPNAEGVPSEPDPQGNPDLPAARSRLTRVAEGILGSPAGDWLEGWERARKVRRLTREAASVAYATEGSRNEAEFSADWCKGHLGTHRQEVMARYRVRLEELEG